jgi:hypothetical protein
MTTIVYLREVDAGTPNACWVVAAKGDPGAIPFQAVGSAVFVNTPPGLGEAIPMTHDLAERMLPEDADERRMFDDNVRAYGGRSLAAIVAALIIMSRSHPPQGSLAKMLAIYANELMRTDEYLQSQSSEIAALRAQRDALAEALGVARRYVKTAADIIAMTEEGARYRQAAKGVLLKCDSALAGTAGAGGLVAPTVTMVGDRLVAEGFKYLNKGEVVRVNADSNGEMFINCCSGADDPANNRRLARFYLTGLLDNLPVGLRRVP